MRCCCCEAHPNEKYAVSFKPCKHKTAGEGRRHTHIKMLILRSCTIKKKFSTFFKERYYYYYTYYYQYDVRIVKRKKFQSEIIAKL